MPALGFLLAWGGYAVTSWGYCLIRGYDVSFTQWVNPVHWYAGGWPPPAASDQELVPSGQAAADAAKGKGKGGKDKAPPVQAV